MAGALRALLALLVLPVAAALGQQLEPEPKHGPGALRSARAAKMLLHHPASATEPTPGDTPGAADHASGAAPSRTQEPKEEETLRNLLDILQQVMANTAPQGTPAQHSALSPTPNDTLDALWSKVYRKHAPKPQSLHKVPTTSNPAPPAAPLALQPDPVGFCVYQSPQLNTALKELAFILQSAAAKRKNKTLEQLINGFSEVFQECFRARHVHYHNDV